MSEMVERVAGAIWEALAAHGVTVDGLLGREALIAQAAIEAMREPTGAMLDAGEFTSPNIVSPSFARELFTAMIDAALKP